MKISNTQEYNIYLQYSIFQHNNLEILFSIKKCKYKFYLQFK